MARHCISDNQEKGIRIGPNLDLSKALNNRYRLLLLRINRYPGHFGVLLIKIHLARNNSEMHPLTEPSDSLVSGTEAAPPFCGLQGSSVHCSVQCSALWCAVCTAVCDVH